ncbi:MAG: siroheme synthase CysG [Myxococcota bacterium]|nr:siroheme synthase CysG [Myxococcota bacterium]
MYPLMLNLGNQRCLVVGGGSVALRKVEGLLLEKAHVTVVAPSPIPAIAALAQRGEIELLHRPYEAGEAGSFALVFAATSVREVNRQVSEDATSVGVWVNVADDPELCSFYLPARVRRGPLEISIASEGAAPFAVRRLRRLLEQRLGPEWGEWAKAARRFRDAIRQQQIPVETAEVLYDRFFKDTVDPTTLATRVPSMDEISEWSGADSYQDIPTPIDTKVQHIDPPSNAFALGLVSLVGAGPGDPGLLTLRGRQRLMAADAVVCDRLAMPALPCDLRNTTEIRFVGKTAGNHPIPQEEINALLIRLARAGKRVVRLKGGDPYIFGRGGEEAEVLHAASIPFEVVPGVTAAIAVPAYAGIPVTFRNEVVRVTLVTAHEAAKSGGPQVRWDLLATDPHAVLLGYMGVTSLPRIVAELLDAGMDPQTPAALIEQGTTSQQRVVTSTVQDLHAAVTREGLRPPALFAIGSTVCHREALDWFGRRPLMGERLVITHSARAFKEALELAGVAVVQVTAPISKASRLVMDALPLTGCVIATPTDAEVIDEERDAPSWHSDATAWCLSQAAADRARTLGWQRVEQVPDATNPFALVQEMAQRIRSTDTRMNTKSSWEQ